MVVKVVLKSDNYWFNNDNDRIIDDQWKLRWELEKHAKIAGMYEIVTSSNEKNIIGTTALDTCYGIVFYDRHNKFGIVGHGSPDTKIDTLISMIKMLGNKPRTIEYAIISGYRNVERGDYRGETQIINYLETHCPKEIKLIPFQTDLDVKICSNILAYEFAFDVNTSESVSYKLFYDGENNRYDKYLR